MLVQLRVHVTRCPTSVRGDPAAPTTLIPAALGDDSVRTLASASPVNAESPSRASLARGQEISRSHSHLAALKASQQAARGGGAPIPAQHESSSSDDEALPAAARTGEAKIADARVTRQKRAIFQALRQRAARRRHPQPAVARPATGAGAGGGDDDEDGEDNVGGDFSSRDAADRLRAQRELHKRNTVFYAMRQHTAEARAMRARERAVRRAHSNMILWRVFRAWRDVTRSYGF